MYRPRFEAIAVHQPIGGRRMKRLAGRRAVFALAMAALLAACETAPVASPTPDTITPTPAPPSPTAPASPSPSALATPMLVFSGQIPTDRAGVPTQTYFFSITNWLDYHLARPDAFRPATGLPGCTEQNVTGTDTPSRAVLDFHDASTGQLIDTFCELLSAAQLERIWFELPRDQPPPRAAYVSLRDRSTGEVARSLSVELTDQWVPWLSPPPSGTPAPTSTASPGAGGTPTPVGALEIDWRPEAADFGPGAQVIDSAVVGNRIVVIGRRWLDAEGDLGSVPAIWWEDEDLVWRQAQLPAAAEELRDIAAGGPGLVVVGSQFSETLQPLVWTSRDGASWSVADVDVGDRAIWLHTVAVARDGLVAFGVEEFGEWATPQAVALVSTSGTTWTPAAGQSTNSLGFTWESAVVGAGPELTAFVMSESGRGAVAIWRAAGADDWRKVGELPESARGNVQAAAIGRMGWVALGTAWTRRGGWTQKGWYSTDGTTWQVIDVAPVKEEAKAVFADRTGFIAVSAYDPVGGCVVSPGNIRNLTWTSLDGRIWRLVDEMRGGAQIETMRRRGRTLIGIGNIGDEEGAVWTAPLPEMQLAEGPLPTPVVLGGGGGCGP